MDGFKGISDNSIDMVLTSPPYDGIRDYKKGTWAIDLPSVGVEIARVLKDGGMAVMVIQDQTSDGRKSGTTFHTISNWITSTELDLWECCIYQRSGTPGAWWNKRFRVDHEFIPIFIKGKRPQYFNKEHMKIPSNNAGSTSFGKATYRTTKGELVESDKEKSFVVAETKCCGTIIDYTKDGKLENMRDKLKKQHPATFPDKLAADFIQAFTTEGMTVLDPFMGSGTTAVVAKSLGRNYIGFELSPEYCKLASVRLQLIG